MGSGSYDGAGNEFVMLFSNIRWIPTGYSFTSSGWKLITMTLDGISTPTAYENTSLIGSFAGGAPAAPSGGTVIGATIGDGGRYYNGKVAAAYFYNKVLSTTEIAQNYNSIAARF
jgi:hypothetical protein